VYIVLTLQKLVYASEIDEKGSIGEARAGGMWKFLHRIFTPSKAPQHNHTLPESPTAETSYTASDDGFIFARTGSHVQKLRRAQRYRSHSDLERLTFMEQHSVLARKNLVVCAEQVSIFLLSGKISEATLCASELMKSR
jgi:hypothetical protein